MTFLLGPLLSFVLLYKYIALFVLEYIAAIIVPLPCIAMLLAVGAFASQGYFNFWLSLIVVTLGNVLGDCTDYGITRKYGEIVIKKLGIDRIRFFRYLKEELRTDAAINVFITRFAGYLGPVVSILSGLVEVPFKTFIFFGFLGDFAEAFIVLLIGYIVGNYWSDFPGIFNIFTSIAAVGVTLFILLKIQRRIVKKYSSHSK